MRSTRLSKTQHMTSVGRTVCWRITRVARLCRTHRFEAVRLRISTPIHPAPKSVQLRRIRASFTTPQLVHLASYMPISAARLWVYTSSLTLRYLFPATCYRHARPKCMCEQLCNIVDGTLGPGRSTMTRTHPSVSTTGPHPHATLSVLI